MSNFAQITKHPNTGKWENAEWIDNCFGNHIYGVQFNDGLLFNTETDKMETMTEEEYQSMIIHLAPQQDTTNGIKIDTISNCCNASVKTITGTNILGEIYECNLCNRSCSLKEDILFRTWGTPSFKLIESESKTVNDKLKEENNGIKTINLSRRVRVYKNNVSIDADIAEDGKITVINTKQHHLENDKHVFKFINSKPGTVKAIAELLLAVSEVK